MRAPFALAASIRAILHLLRLMAANSIGLNFFLVRLSGQATFSELALDPSSFRIPRGSLPSS